MRIKAIHHATLAMLDLSRAVGFHRDVLGCNLQASWTDGAYLQAGSLWLWLSHAVNTRQTPHPDHTHLAFDVAATDFDDVSRKIRPRTRIWKENKSEEYSLYFLGYFLDPYGHKLELHAGSLASRLDHCQIDPPPGWRVYTELPCGGP